uniref:Uncharacterized protein n=1 Tax=Avena sativa TaxID=4498 RepID=A0ACD5ZCZ2_AVESA
MEDLTGGRLLDDVLDGKDYLRSAHVQAQFFGSQIKFSIACCQYFFAPAMLHDCMWDMVSRAIHVFDPLAGRQGPDAERKQSLKFMASTLHDALFDCLHEYFAGWPTQKDSWSTIYPSLFDTSFTRPESGPITLHILRYYDGERLKFPITKNNLDKTRLDALHEVMKLHENRSPLPGDVIWNALAPSQFSFREFLNEEED